MLELMKKRLSKFQEQTQSNVLDFEKYEKEYFVGETLFEVTLGTDNTKLLKMVGLDKKFTVRKMIARVTEVQDNEPTDYEFAIYITEIERDSQRINGFWNTEKGEWYITVGSF